MILIRIVACILFVGALSDAQGMNKRQREENNTSSEGSAKYRRTEGFSEKRLIRNAEFLGYGYKYANLVELKNVVLNLRQGADTVRVDVPEFFGISSGGIVQCLKNIGFDIQREWEAVIGTLVEEDREVLFRTKKIPEKFWRAQKAFVTQLKEACDSLVDEVNPLHLDEENLAELSKLLHKTSQDKVMVRSTGKEDTRTMANAGGNESVANIAPNMLSVWRAATRVIVSYFDEKSIHQRLGLGDRTLFDLQVFCPVLIQRMIGEREGKEIPRCGVMFTEEAEGGISYQGKKDESGTVKTTGITMIQAAYGHNEGVVNSRIAVDTYVAQNIDGYPVFYPAIQLKRTRLVPMEHGLKERRNSELLACASALDDKVLVTLKKCADELEKYYGYPMDVEFVVRDETVWIVQARPIVHSAERRVRVPGYIHGIEGRERLTGRVIGAFGGSVIGIESLKECIVSDRINGALDSYLAGDRNRIKAVFVGTDAPATSHEATTFRSEGKPVMYVHDISGLSEALQAGKKLLFSPQQQSVVIVDRVEEIEVRGGWCAYPLPRELSAVSSLFINAHNFVMPKRNGKEIDVKELLQALRSQDDAAARLAAQVLPDAVYEVLVRKVKRSGRDADIDEQIKLVIRGVQEVCRRIQWLCRKGATHLERLVPVLYVEALVYQQIAGDKALRYVSVATVGKVLKQERGDEVADSVGSREVKELCTQLIKLREYAFDDTTRNAWVKLIGGLANREEVQGLRTLGTLVATMNEYGILPLWLHSVMVNGTNNVGSESYMVLVSQWGKGFYDKAKEFGLVKEMLRRVETFNKSRFADPKTYNEAWREFQELHNACMSEEFLGVIKIVTEHGGVTSSQQLVASAACNVLSKFVDLFDTGIKEVKGSNLWNKQDCLATFKKMVQAYYAVLNKLVGLVKISGADESLNLIKIVLDSRGILDSDLEPTRGFDVTGFVLASGMNLASNVTKPKTLEDAFTLIHQDLFVVVSQLGKLCGAESVMCSELLRSVENMIKSLSTTVSFIGTEITVNGIRKHYNYPLRNHSCQFFIGYDAKRKEVYVTANFYGHRPERWRVIVDFIDLIKEYLSAEAKELLAQDASCRCTFVVKTDSDIKNLSGLLKVCLDYTLLSIIEPFATYLANLCSKEVIRTVALNACKRERIETQIIGLVFLRVLVRKGLAYEAALGVATRFIESTHTRVQAQALNLFKALVEKGQAYKAALDAATRLIESTDTGVQWRGLDLFKALVEKGQAYKAALDAATRLIESTDTSVQSKSLDLFRALVGKGQAYKTALGVATRWIEIMHIDYQSQSFDLFKMLVGKGQAYKEALLVATRWIESRNPRMQRLGLELLKVLVGNGQAYKEALGFATRFIESTDTSVRSQALDLFKVLVGKEQAYKEAFGVATRLIESTDTSVQRLGLELLKALVEKEQAYEAALRVATCLIESTDIGVQNELLDLLKALVNKGQAYKEALDVATRLINSTYTYIQREIALDLFKALVEKGQAYKEALEVATRFIESTDSSEQWRGLELLNTLVEKGQVYKEALEVATRFIESTDTSEQCRALRLFKALVEKEQAYKEALEVATRLIESTDTDVQSQALDLFKVLVGKEQAYKEAFGVATRLIESTDTSVQRLGLDLFKALVGKEQAYEAALDAATCFIESMDTDVQSQALDLFKLLITKGQSEKINKVLPMLEERIGKDSEQMQVLKKELRQELKQPLQSGWRSWLPSWLK